MKIIKTGLNIAAGTLFLSAVSPAVNVMNQVGLGASVPVPIQTLSNWTCPGLVPDHRLFIKRRCAHNPEGFSIDLRNAASEDYRNH
ncbi:hypothetical protein AA0481_1386 [Acetobacter orientalis NRIC 0481]|uniref:Uncharacterized protein n=1 Tax=Acetobacter orientalis TaxID=146474 RepID=A0A0D6NKS0_9PROT|nr:hypothetical protein Abor_014_131 [Acetobacter orientalis]GBR17526.1 hypothetical protein AA0481_1386 [Acetobacter orientalis NRIC 0481]GEL60360.1 hypothetical protein AOR02nite_02020 [Acetobacter orientalis]